MVMIDSRASGRGFAPTPLGIIALFVGLAETVTGLAATQTLGGTQIAFTSFAVGFPLLVGAAFFTVLWARPYVLYPPKEFGSNVDVARYVEAMRQHAVTEQQVLGLVRTSIADAVTSSQALEVIKDAALPTVGSDARTAALEQAAFQLAQQAVERLERATISVDLSPISAGALGTAILPFDPNEQAYTFVSAIYFLIDVYVRPFTYAKGWILVDITTGQPFLPQNVDWDEQHAIADSRLTVADFGLKPGMRIRAEAFSHQERRALLSKKDPSER